MPETKTGVYSSYKQQELWDMYTFWVFHQQCLIYILYWRVCRVMWSHLHYTQIYRVINCVIFKWLWCPVSIILITRIIVFITMMKTGAENNFCILKYSFWDPSRCLSKSKYTEWNNNASNVGGLWLIFLYIHSP